MTGATGVVASVSVPYSDVQWLYSTRKAVAVGEGKRKGGVMESFAPILGLSMIVFGLIMLAVCLGGLAYLYLTRSASRVEQRRAGAETALAETASDRQSGDSQQ